MTPTMKMKQPMMMVVLRPVKSATSPAMMAPKKVPADRMETIRDLREAGRVNWSAVSSLSSSEGDRPVWRVMKYFMPNTPLM